MLYLNSKSCWINILLLLIWAHINYTWSTPFQGEQKLLQFRGKKKRSKKNSSDNGSATIPGSTQRHRLGRRLRHRPWLRSQSSFLSPQFSPSKTLWNEILLQVFKFQLFSVTSVPPEQQKVWILDSRGFLESVCRLTFWDQIFFL